MTQPSAYSRAFNFSNFQAEHPADPLPAGSLDEELSRVKAVIDQIRTSIRYLQRDDYALANATVGFDQLKTEIEIGVNPPSTWATSTNYVVRDSVFKDQKFYICDVSHISGTFADDLAAEKWELIADFTAAQAASLVTYDNTTSGIAATTLQDAVDEIAGSINVSSVFGRAGAVVAEANDYSADQIEFDPTGFDHVDGASDVAGAIADLDSAVTALGALPGEIKIWPGATAPTGYLFCFGQTVSRTTYASLFSAIGTVWGAGDGSTTFKLPDLRGRVLAGKDDMGGTSANRLTAFSGGVNGDTLGAAGGSEKHTLTEAQLPSVQPAFTGDALEAHGHPARYGPLSGSSTNTTGGLALQSADVNKPAYTGTPDATAGHQIGGASAGTPSGTISSFGSDEAHNNVQPTAIVNFIIKT